MSCRRIVLCLLLVASGAGCASMLTTTVPLKSSFDATAAMQMLAVGTNTIEGSALIRQQGGGVVTCAGEEVTLVPVTEYATERMMAIYGSDQRGYRGSGLLKFTPDDPAYYSASRTVLGDAQGNFLFDKVADGDFFVTTTVTWTAGYARQGGVLMQRVKVTGGETKRIVLSP